jgi:hypothetical protein
VFIKNRGELIRLSGAPLLVEALEAALEAADPYCAVLRHVKRVGDDRYMLTIDFRLENGEGKCSGSTTWITTSWGQRRRD